MCAVECCGFVMLTSKVNKTPEMMAINDLIHKLVLACKSFLFNLKLFLILFWTACG